ncbi:MAG TPA: hypothetical protein VFE68_05940, partial [Vicinamibacteria bacterium]|nr:hypothetical protein [Vicinamibacteria bacterium]
MTTRRAAAVVTAALLLAVAPSTQAQPVVRPRLLLAERDPFSGLPALKARYAAGARPSDDLPGWALTYLVSGDETFARRAVEALRTQPLPTKGGSNLYMAYMGRALAFDWLYGFAGFDAALKDRVA